MEGGKGKKGESFELLGKVGEEAIEERGRWVEHLGEKWESIELLGKVGRK